MRTKDECDLGEGGTINLDGLQCVIYACRTTAGPHLWLGKAQRAILQGEVGYHDASEPFRVFLGNEEDEGRDLLPKHNCMRRNLWFTTKVPTTATARLLEFPVGLVKISCPETMQIKVPLPVKAASGVGPYFLQLLVSVEVGGKTTRVAGAALKVEDLTRRSGGNVLRTLYWTDSRGQAHRRAGSVSFQATFRRNQFASNGMSLKMALEMSRMLPLGEGPSSYAPNFHPVFLDVKLPRELDPDQADQLALQPPNIPTTRSSVLHALYTALSLPVETTNDLEDYPPSASHPCPDKAAADQPDPACGNKEENTAQQGSARVPDKIHEGGNHVSAWDLRRMVEGDPKCGKPFQPSSSCLVMLAPKILESRRLATLQIKEAGMGTALADGSLAPQSFEEAVRKPLEACTTPNPSILECGAADSSKIPATKSAKKRKRKKAKAAPTFNLADLLPEHYAFRKWAGPRRERSTEPDDSPFQTEAASLASRSPNQLSAEVFDPVSELLNMGPGASKKREENNARLIAWAQATGGWGKEPDHLEGSQHPAPPHSAEIAESSDAPIPDKEAPAIPAVNPSPPTGPSLTTGPASAGKNSPENVPGPSMQAQLSMNTTQTPAPTFQPGLLPDCSFTFGKNVPENELGPHMRTQLSTGTTQTPSQAFQPGPLPDCSFTFGSLPAQSSHLQPGNSHPPFPAAWTARPMFGGGVALDAAGSTAGMRLSQPLPPPKRAREPTMIRGGSHIPAAERRQEAPLFTVGSNSGPADPKATQETAADTINRVAPGHGSRCIIS